MRKVPKFLPRYCGPFKVIKCIGSIDYKLELPKGSCMHLVFHVSLLCKCLYEQDQAVDSGILVEYEEPPVQSHELESILYTHDLQTRHHI